MILKKTGHAPARIQRYVKALNAHRRKNGSAVRYGLRYDERDPLVIYLVAFADGATRIVGCWYRTASGWKGYTFQPNGKDVAVITH